MHPITVYLFLFLSIGGTAVAQPQAYPDSLFDIQDTVLIPTRSGHAISAMIVTKKGNARPLPAILFYTTYDQGAGDSFFGKIPADRGYAGVVAYARGIRTNIEEYAPYEHDGNDAYDVIDWISRQPWCDGRVGMFGGSYTGFVQWAAVKKIHPALKTIVPQVAVMPGFDAPMENNVPQGFALGWANDILRLPPLPDDLSTSWYEAGTSYRSLDSLAGHPNRIFQRWLRHPEYDEYWRSLVPTPGEYRDLDIPILCTTGYYDGSQAGAVEYIRQYSAFNEKENLSLVIGPYDHWGAQRGKPADTLMGYAIDPVARMSMRGLAFDWFDHIFKGAPRPDILKDKINYEVMGLNEWKHAPSLGEMNNDTLVLYLSDSKQGVQYSLATEKPERRAYLDQMVDFADRSTQNNYFTPFIINDSLDASNGLVFATEPFQEAVTLNGGFYGSLSASINKKDMDISVAFYEQLPGGAYFYLTRYLGRASYANSDTVRELLRPDSVETIPLRETRLVSKRFKKGSRLVIVLNVNKHPFEEINYGTGKDVHDETIADAEEPLRIQWYNDSRINIPVWRGDR